MSGDSYVAYGVGRPGLRTERTCVYTVPDLVRKMSGRFYRPAPEETALGS